VIGASGSSPRVYASVFARARSLLGVTALAIAPLGALAGVVGACGGGPPIDPRVEDDAGAHDEISSHLASEPMASGSASVGPSDAPPVPSASSSSP
jgi:hypothetical protein